jgi:hypothetical protein
MIDVNQITTTLRGLPDRMLQQYAMMNKANPYVLSLAVAESNQRKQLRTAAQARAMSPQPKVADAAIAGIAEAPAVDAMGNVTGMAAGGLPEDQGIGRLPAPNMQRMADGGIAGYDDQQGMAQGGMFDFAQRSEPVVRMAGGGAVEFSKGGGGITEMRKLVLKELGETPTNYLQDPEVKRTVDKLVQERLGTTTTPTATTATSSAAQPKPFQKSIEAGQKYGPTLTKVGEKVSDIGTTKTSKLPLGGGAKTAGILGLGGGLYEGYTQGDFYNDPNVPAIEKAKQATLTAGRAGLPMFAAGVGSLFTPVGTAVGTVAGTAAAAMLPAETEALEAWKKANPRATPEETKKAAAKIVPTYSPDQQSNAEAQRLGLKVNPNTMSKLPEAAEPADTGMGGQGGPGGVGGGGAGAGGSSAQSIKDMYALFAGKPEERQAKRDAIRGQLGELAGAETLQAQNMYKQLQDDLAARGEYGKDKEAKLKAKGERIAKEEGQSGGLALLEAGLAMMSGASPNAFTNIGQGAMVGTAAYRKSMDKITDAKDKLDDAYGRLEDVRFNQKNMDTKELREAKAGIDKAANAGLKSLIQFAGQELDMDTKEATTMFGGAINLQQANIAAGPGYQRNAMMAKRFAGDDKKMAEFTKVQKQVMADLKNDTNYSTAPTEAAKDRIYKDRLRAALSTNPFLSAYAMNLGFEAEPTGTVRNAEVD